MKTINYNGNLIEYKSSHRGLNDYAVMKGSDEVDGYNDTLKLMFCLTRAQAKIKGIKFDLDLEQFIDWLDANPDAIQGFVLAEAADNEKEPGKEDQKKST